MFCSAYCGGLWLASLCVMCKMARLMEDEEKYQRYRDILDRGSAAFDKLLWNGKKSSIPTGHRAVKTPTDAPTAFWDICLYLGRDDGLCFYLS